jgi:NADPH:quinone reductase-like Zn-dependent oxidoreductase
MREAAALPLAVITAWEGLVDRARFRRGQRVLVHGGAGGAGHVAVQLALARGAEVVATGSPGSLPVIEGPGATAIDYATPVADYVAAHTGGEGFDGGRGSPGRRGRHRREQDRGRHRGVNPAGQVRPLPTAPPARR